MSVKVDGIRVYWGDDFENMKENFFLGMATSLKEAVKIAMDYKARRKIGSERYSRFFVQNPNTLVMDYGSHVQFFLFVGEDMETKIGGLLATTDE